MTSGSAAASASGNDNNAKTCLHFLNIMGLTGVECDAASFAGVRARVDAPVTAKLRVPSPPRLSRPRAVPRSNIRAVRTDHFAIPMRRILQRSLLRRIVHVHHAETITITLRPLE